MKLTRIFNLPFLRGLRPGWPDEARIITQEHAFRALLDKGDGGRLSGKSLNAGCGEGLYTGFLRSHQAVTQIVSLDLYLTGHSKAAKTDPRHAAVRGSLTALPFAGETFDSCLCSEVIEHIPDDRRAVAELARVLKRGGLLLLSVPTPPAPFDPEHVREGYSLSQLTVLLGSSGLKVKGYVFCFHFFMRVLYSLWSWQFVRLGGRRRSYMPRYLILLLGYADRYIKLGRPWDLVVLAEK